MPTDRPDHVHIHVDLGGIVTELVTIRTAQARIESKIDTLLQTQSDVAAILQVTAKARELNTALDAEREALAAAVKS